MTMLTADFFAPDETAVQEGWGHCPKCKRWRSYETGHCPVCEHALEGHVLPDKELARQFFPMLLAVQEIEDDTVMKVRTPGYWYNANTEEMRRAIKELVSVAVMAQIMLPPGMMKGVQAGKAQPAPRQIMTMENGAQYEVEMVGGRLRVIRQVAAAPDPAVTAAPAAAPAAPVRAPSPSPSDLPFDPELDGDPDGDGDERHPADYAVSETPGGAGPQRRRPSSKTCEVCGTVVTGTGFGLTGEMRRHVQAAHPGVA